MTTIQLTRDRYGVARNAIQIDGDTLRPLESLRHVNHSPDGFEWGYGGSGPMQLAFAILLHVTGDPEFARECYSSFCQTQVALWPRTGNHDIEIDVVKWSERRGWKRGTIAEQAIAVCEAYHQAHPNASWVAHEANLAAAGLGFTTDTESDCCVFADGSATDPDLERAYPNLEAAAQCDDCVAAQADGYTGCGGCYGE